MKYYIMNYFSLFPLKLEELVKTVKINKSLRLMWCILEHSQHISSVDAADNFTQ